MIIVFDIRDMLSELRRQYIKITSQEPFNIHYKEVDFIEFALWNIKKYLHEERLIVQDFNDQYSLEYLSLSSTLLDEEIYGNKATIYDIVYMTMKGLNINFVHDQKYIYSIMIVQTNLVIGRTDKSYFIGTF
jgi:hypothetical protein